MACPAGFPDVPTAQAYIDQFSPELVAAAIELRALGLTDDSVEELTADCLANALTTVGS